MKCWEAVMIMKTPTWTAETRHAARGSGAWMGVGRGSEGLLQRGSGLIRVNPANALPVAALRSACDCVSRGGFAIYRPRLAMSGLYEVDPSSKTERFLFARSRGRMRSDRQL